MLEKEDDGLKTGEQSINFGARQKGTETALINDV